MTTNTTRRAALITGGLVVSGAVFAGVASATPRNFGAHMTTDAHEEPDTNAVGQVTFQLRNNKLSFRLIVANIQDVTMGHIHLEDVGGPVSVWLHDFETASPSLIEGRVNGVVATGTITDEEVGGPIDTVADLVDEIDNENAYVNVHTEAFPGGEIGGQIHARN